MFWRARAEDRQADAVIHRFDPRFWTVNFAPPMMATVVSEGPDALSVRCSFYRRNDLAGLIWASEDRIDHPLLAYETRRDYRGVRLRFDWLSSGVAPLNAVWGPTLTIEGRTPEGHARTWYVRLWNYAEGTGTDAAVVLDFDDLAGGFTLPDQADPVWAGDIDRLFVSLVPPDYDPGDPGPLPTAGHGVVQLRGIRAEGWNQTLSVGDVRVPPHRLKIATGFDDVYNQAPSRLLRGLRHLGYRDALDLYVGMAHFLQLRPEPSGPKLDPDQSLCPPAEAWFAALFAECAAWDIEVIASISFEVLASYAPEAWAQRAHDGAMALTGWSPPSTLLSPANADAMAWLERVFLRFGELMEAAGLPVVLQIGEPWWWTGFGADVAPCFYDQAALDLYEQESGQAAPARHITRFEVPDAPQSLYLDWLGQKLGQATLRLRDAVKARWPDAQMLLLFYTPQVLEEGAPMLAQANLPAAWAAPAFDRLQLEDYDHVIAGAWQRRARGLDQALAILGYARTQSDYFAGFVLDPAEAALWQQIDEAADRALAEGFARVFVWAQPQMARDGYVRFDLEEEVPAMSGFHEERLPVRISFGSTGGPGFSTTVVEMVSGHEQRNINWAQARARYDLASGLTSEQDLAQLTAFFRARRGRAYGFRFKDWSDFSSGGDGIAPPTAFDQLLGEGDGQAVRFPLVKRYGTGDEALIRPIAKPVDGSVRIGIDGQEETAGWTLDPATGWVEFDAAPAAGAVLTAGFEFDVPVRFASDSLSISLESFRAGAVDSVALLEVRVDR